jgi:hypothetical protein
MGYKFFEFMLLIIQHLKNYLISFGSVIAQPPCHSPTRSGNPEGRLDWAIQKKLDYPVKRLCRNYLKCEFVILNPSQCVTLRFAQGKLREESHEINAV